MKKLWFLILATALISSLVFAFGCGDKNNDEKAEIAFQEMQEESSENCKLGDMYNLKTEISDTNGKKYRLNATVTTKSGEKVGVFNNVFSIDDVEGYVVTYKTIVNEKEYKFVVNITVEDTLPPSISINKPEPGVRGEKYYLPNISISDMGQSEVTVSVGKKSAEKTVITKDSEGKYSFVPDETGIYEINVKAVKSNGKQDEKTVEIIVDNKMEDGEIFYPGNFSAKSNIEFKGDSLTNNVLKTEFKEGDGEDKDYNLPYVSITSTGTYWDRISRIIPRGEEEYYSQFNSVEMWIYFSSTSKYSQISLFNDHIYTIPSNKWTKIVCSMTDYLNNIKKDPFLPFKFNDKIKPEYSALTEVRLGNIKAFNGKEREDNVLFDVVSDGSYSFGGFMSAGNSIITSEIKKGNSEDKIYKGAFVEFNATKEDWGRIQYVRQNNISKDISTNSVSMWVNFTSKSSDVQIAFFNTDILTIPANKWVKISLDKKKFASVKDNFIPWKNHSAWDKGKAITQVKVGTITAENSDLNGNVMFSVKDDLSYVYGSYAVAGDSKINATLKSGDKEDKVYNGAYVSFVPTVEAWGRIQRVTACKKLDEYTQNTIKMWIFIKSDAKTAPINFFDNPEYKQDVETNKWTQVTLDMAVYKANQNKSFLPFKYVKSWLNITEIRIGDIIAE